MYNFIFDIDDTLYQNRKLKKPLTNDVFHMYYLFSQEKNSRKKYAILEKIILRYQQTFKYDQYLDTLMKKIPYPKHIITNSRNIHCFTTLHLLGMKKHMNIILTAETQPLMKPYPMIYKHFEHLNQKNYQNIFFDDRPENLVIPNKLGWITVLITPQIYKTKNTYHIDYVFKDIYQALEYFYLKINNNKNELKKN
jgi:HAD superfamily hydrolase (TIGR01509 family)